MKFNVMCFLVLSVVFVGSIQAEDTSRKGKWDLFLNFQNFDSATVESGSEDLEIDSYSLSGIGLAYYMSDDLAVNLEFLGGETEFNRKTESGVDDALAIDASVVMLNVNLDYNASMLSLFEDKLTPYISGGLGVYAFSEETNDVKDEYDTSSNACFNAGAGLRFQFNEDIYIKAGYRSFNTKIKDSGSDNFGGFSFTFGWVF